MYSMKLVILCLHWHLDSFFANNCHVVYYSDWSSENVHVTIRGFGAGLRYCWELEDNRHHSHMISI